VLIRHDLIRNVLNIELLQFYYSHLHGPVLKRRTCYDTSSLVKRSMHYERAARVCDASELEECRKV
jgi:hypothetical protein